MSGNQHYQWMTSYFQRLIGAQFKKKLDAILAFGYPQPTPHLYHTMWCPPLRIVVLNVDKSSHKVLFDQVVRPWKFVKLPAGNVVLEMNPDDQYDEVLTKIVTDIHGNIATHNLPVGGVNSNVSVGNLIYAMFADALAELRSVKMTSLNERGLLDPEKLVKRYQPWERGKFLASAGFVLDYQDSPWLLPRGVVPLSADLLKFEKPFADELLAADSAAHPTWKSTLSPTCIGCRAAASWRPIIQSDDKLPVEKSWRLLRPENHIPLCASCTKRFKTNLKYEVRFSLGSAFWGARFDAIDKWHNSEMDGSLPANWDKAQYPLWPEQFGGDTWEAGSGAITYVTPAWPRKVKRTKKQLEVLKNAGVYKFVLEEDPTVI